MNQIINLPGEGTYVTLPRFGSMLLYAKFNDGNSISLSDKFGFGIELLASEGVNVLGDLKDVYNGDEGAKALFEVTTKFNRGKVHPNPHTKIHSEGLEDYLGKEYHIDVSDESVKAAAEEIKSRLEPEYKEDPASIVHEIIGWIRENIEYSPSPKYLLDHVREVIESLPEEQRYDPLAIFRNSDFKNYLVKLAGANTRLHPEEAQQQLEEISDYINLPDSVKDSNELAEILMAQALDQGRFSRLFEFEKDSAPARPVIASKEGNSTSIANLFVSLARNLGIPSKKLSGYYCGYYTVPEQQKWNFKSWVAAYLHPYGWKEIDTCTSVLEHINNFHWALHAYELSPNYFGRLPDLTIIEGGESYDPKFLDEVTELLQKEKSRRIDDIQGKLHWWDRKFKTSKSKKIAEEVVELDGLYEYELDLLEILKKEALKTDQN